MKKPDLKITPNTCSIIKQLHLQAMFKPGKQNSKYTYLNLI